MIAMADGDGDGHIDFEGRLKCNLSNCSFDLYSMLRTNMVKSTSCRLTYLILPYAAYDILDFEGRLK